MTARDTLAEIRERQRHNRTSEDIALLERAEKAESDAELFHTLLLNLLARCHRDVGHRTGSIGLEQSAAEADRKVAQAYVDAERAKKAEAEVERLRGELDRLRTLRAELVRECSTYEQLKRDHVCGWMMVIQTLVNRYY